MDQARRISTDPAAMDLDMIHGFLAGEAPWSRGMPRPVLQRALENSLCFGVWHEGRQVGFARVVTDYATFAWLCDVFVLPEQRGRGHARALMQAVVTHPQLQGLRRFSLASSTARGLYAAFGFMPPRHPSSLMEKFDPDVYRSTLNL